jgi:hypothetical protein
MPYSVNFSEQWELIDFMYTLAGASNTEFNTGYSSIANYPRVVIIIHPMDINDALDVDIEQALTTAGGSAKLFHANDHDITVATTDTEPSVIEIVSEEFDATNKFDCLNVEITTANTGGEGNDFVVEIWGETAYAPAATTNLDSVTS